MCRRRGEREKVLERKKPSGSIFCKPLTSPESFDPRSSISSVIMTNVVGGKYINYYAQNLRMKSFIKMVSFYFGCDNALLTLFQGCEIEINMSNNIVKLKKNLISLMQFEI